MKTVGRCIVVFWMILSMIYASDAIGPSMKTVAEKAAEAISTVVNSYGEKK
jgi:hypothetical protein